MSPGCAIAGKEPLRGMAMATIQRLDLNAEETKAMRAQHISDFLAGQVSEAYLRRHSPFVWQEMERQGRFR
jgi:hypothetical protein